MGESGGRNTVTGRVSGLIWGGSAGGMETDGTSDGDISSPTKISRHRFKRAQSMSLHLERERGNSF